MFFYDLWKAIPSKSYQEQKLIQAGRDPAFCLDLRNLEPHSLRWEGLKWILAKCEKITQIYIHLDYETEWVKDMVKPFLERCKKLESFCFWGPSLNWLICLDLKSPEFHFYANEVSEEEAGRLLMFVNLNPQCLYVHSNLCEYLKKEDFQNNQNIEHLGGHFKEITSRNYHRKNVERCLVVKHCIPVPDLVDEVLGYVFGDGILSLRASPGGKETLVSEE